MSVPAERRRFERHEIKLRARLARADGRQTACLVRDYCSGGMLVPPASWYPPAVPGRAVTS